LRPKLLAAGILGVGGVAACASLFNIQGGVLEDGGADASSDGIADAGPDYVLHDAVSLDVNTAICDGAVMVTTNAAWVDHTTGTDMTGCGLQTEPCQSIGYALVHTTSTTIYVGGPDTYEENLVLGAGYANYTLQGGWIVDDAGNFSQACANNLAIIQGPADGGSATVDIHGASNVVLRLLTIRSKVNGAPGTGESVYAVRVVDTANVVVDNDTLLAQYGGDGVNGAGGGTGSGCNTTSPTTGTPAPGATGSAGNAGTFDPASGYQPVFAGDGGVGNQGTHNPGQSGASGTCGTCGYE